MIKHKSKNLILGGGYNTFSQVGQFLNNKRVDPNEKTFGIQFVVYMYFREIKGLFRYYGLNNPPPLPPDDMMDQIKVEVDSYINNLNCISNNILDIQILTFPQDITNFSSFLNVMNFDIILDNNRNLYKPKKVKKKIEVVSESNDLESSDTESKTSEDSFQLV